MAQKVEVHLEDDLDGGPADTTLAFALDGRDYEIDLSDANAEKLREALRPFVAAGRKTTRGTGARSTGARSTGARAAGSDPDTAKIRAWAKENGHQVSDRGRIHQSVKDAYYAATGRSRRAGPCAVTTASGQDIRSRHRPLPPPARELFGSGKDTAYGIRASVRWRPGS